MRARVLAVLRRPGAALVGAALLLLALALTADLTGSPAGGSTTAGRAASVPAPPAVPVARADAVCPDPAAGPGTGTLVRVAAPGGLGGPGRAGGSAPPGHARLSGLGGAPLPVDLAPPSSGAVLAAAGQGPVVVRATGAAAPGLAAGMLTRSTLDAMRGLAGTACAEPGTDFWFVGSGALVGQRGRVYLTNPEPAPAVVDITLYGPDGPLETPGGRGISVAAGKQEVRLLDALAPGITRFGIHVHARSGRVAVGVRDQQLDGLTPRGADWLPAARAPARRQVVPGVVAGAGARLLQVVAPGDRDAIVKLRLVTESGSFAPSGADVLEVPAGAVAQVDLAAAIAGAAVAVTLDSDVPVTAGLLARATGSTGQLTDIAYTAAARPLLPATPGAVPESRQAKGVTSSLLLSAPGADATVRLAPVAPATGTPSEVRVPGGSQVVVDLATVTTAADFSVTVTPDAGSGPVYAARAVAETEAKGPMLTTEPVDPGRFTVTVPRVVADLSTGLRPGG